MRIVRKKTKTRTINVMTGDVIWVNVCVCVPSLRRLESLLFVIHLFRSDSLGMAFRTCLRCWREKLKNKKKREREREKKPRSSCINLSYFPAGGLGIS